MLSNLAHVGVSHARVVCLAASGSLKNEHKLIAASPTRDKHKGLFFLFVLHTLAVVVCFSGALSYYPPSLAFILFNQNTTAYAVALFQPTA